MTLARTEEIRELYQDLLLDHSRDPRNYRALEKPSHEAQGYNPLCGDRYTVFVALEGERIADVAFLGSGCAISKASASLMTTALKGKRVLEALGLFEKFRSLLTSDAPPSSELGKLAVFAGVREFPVRVKCATLPWHTLKAALDGKAEAVSSE